MAIIPRAPIMLHFGLAVRCRKIWQSKEKTNRLKRTPFENEMNETDLDDLKQFMRVGDFKKACEILAAIPAEHWPVTIPIKTLEIVIEGGKYKDSTAAMEILVKLSRANKKALEALLRYLRSSSKEKDEECFLAILNVERHFSPKEVEIIPSDILLMLIQHPNRLVRSFTLSLLLKASRDVPSAAQKKIPTNVLFDAFLRETVSTNREEILEIGKIINPFMAKDYITLDTLLLINWIRDKNNIMLSGLDELLDSIQRRYLSDKHVFSYINSLMISSRATDKFASLILSRRFRDHEVHQCNVGVLGLLLLEIYVSPSETLKEYISSITNWLPEDVEKAWLITAFLHDHARPIEFMLSKAPIVYRQKSFPDYQAHLDGLFDLFRPIEKNVFSNDLRKIYDGLLKGKDELPNLENLISDELRKVRCIHKIKRNEILNHGILAAVNLTTTLRSINNVYVDESEIVKTSARAMAIHNIASEKVELEKDPIAFLLVLCDETQEWERESIKDTPSIKIGKFTSRNDRIFFREKFEVFFEYPASNSLEYINWNAEKFKSGKNVVKERLDLTGANINPHQIDFIPHTPPSVQKKD